MEFERMEGIIMDFISKYKVVTSVDITFNREKKLVFFYPSKKKFPIYNVVYAVINVKTSLIKIEEIKLPENIEIYCKIPEADIMAKLLGLKCNSLYRFHFHRKQNKPVLIDIQCI
jgi:hypothetical protein